MRLSATYRLQLTPDFTLYDAATVVPYLSELGVSHLYCSPWLQAAPGSTHGYDVVDHTRVSTELGGADGLAALVSACHRHRLGIVLDLVPNHMAVPNPKWDDVQEHGQQSPYAGWFDIDWAHGGTYRRFFDIDGLAAVRVEDAGVFEATHGLVLQQVRSGVIDGLRIDHPDGLADPEGYLDRLAEATGGRWTVVEKILAGDERLPRHWRCAGTTGYDALAHVGGLFVDPEGEGPLTQTYADLTGAEPRWEPVVRESKRSIAEHLHRDIAWVARLAAEATGRPAEAVHEALVELLVALPVYRVYVRPGEPVEPAARECISAAAAEAVAARPDLTEVVRAVAEAVLTGPAELVTRFQQVSGPVMAKGVEDTAGYRYHRLLALNEVGSDPGHWGTCVDEFHAFAVRISRDWPATMTTLSTHDTKRSEDVRARLAVLSEIPDEWRAAVESWTALAPAPPDRKTAYLLWQTLVGAWPISAERLRTFAEKAVREAKERTAWVDGDPAYEAAVATYVDALLDDPRITTAVESFVARISAAATANSLAQKLLMLTMPGVPDLYQGSERPIYSLVDPDNRRPVDFAAAARDLTMGADTKQRVVEAALSLRRAMPEWYRPGAGYLPVHAEGPAADHVVAFVRGGAAVTVVPRCTERLARTGGWRDTYVDVGPGPYENVFTNAMHTGRVPMTELFADLPVALLVYR